MDSISSTTASVVRNFNDALNSHDIESVMALMTDDCVFEDNYPFPDGIRHEGAAAVRDDLGKFYSKSPHARFDEEELIACDDRCVVRWRYTWGDGHIRGVNVMRVRDGKVSENLSYVKG